MPRFTEISVEQNLVNKINGRVGFSHAFKPADELGRYVVGFKTLLVSPNPSIYARVHTIVDEALNSAPERAEVFGGWLDTKTNLYHVDYSTTHNGLGVASAIAFLRGELAIWDRLECKEITL